MAPTIVSANSKGHSKCSLTHCPQDTSVPLRDSGSGVRGIGSPHPTGEIGVMWKYLGLLPYELRYLGLSVWVRPSRGYESRCRGYR